MVAKMKEETTEIIKNFSDTVKERIKNPVISTFVISWCVYNWQSLLVITLSKETIKERIDIVSPMIHELTSWLFPLVFTIIYLFFNKRINFFFLKKLEKVDHDFIVVEYSRKKKELILQKENEELRAEKDMAYEDTKTNKEKEIQEMKEQITVSKDKEGALTKEIDELKKEKEFNRNEMKELQKTNSMQQAEIDTLFLENEKLTKHLEQNGIAAKDKEIRELTLKLNEMTAIRNEYEAQAKRLEEKLKKNGWVNG